MSGRALGIVLALALAACGRREQATGAAIKPTPLLHTQKGDRRAIVYGADWCEACDKATTWLTARGYTVVERDVDKERDAPAAMQEALDAAGLTSPGIPVVELEGAVVLGFDEKRLTALTAR